MMQPGDLPAVWSMSKAQDRRDGLACGVPPIFDLDPASPTYAQLVPNVALALVTEDEEGRVRQAHLFLRTIELQCVGGGRDRWEFSIGHIPLALEALRAQGYTEVNTFVPKPRVRGLQRLLDAVGFRRLDQRLAHFFRTI